MAQEPHEQRLARVLKRVGMKRVLQHGAGAAHGGGREHSWEGVDWRNPLSELIETEERAARDALLDALEAGLPADAERLREVVFEQFRQFESEFMEWIFAGGVNPLDVVKRLFAYAKYRRPDLLLDMSFRDLGDLLNEEHATMHARCVALFGETPAGWKKTASARENMRISQQGNRNRLGGNKLPPKKNFPPQKTKKTKHKK